MPDAQRGLEMLDANTRILAMAAIRRGIPADIYRLSPNVGRWILRLGIDGKVYHYRAGALYRSADATGATLGAHINGVAAEMCLNKGLTLALLASAGISVPRGKAFEAGELGKALQYALDLGTAVCVKPVDGKNANSAFPNLTDPAAIRAAIEQASRFYSAIMVEESVGPFEMRYLYAAPRIVAVKTSRRLTVPGDGNSTVGQLLDAVNAERDRRALPSHHSVAVTEDFLRLLDAQGLTLDAVPEPGRDVALSWTANGIKGGITADGRRTVHPSYAAVAKAACEAIPGFVFGAVDMMVKSFSEPARPDNYWILEVNASPGIGTFHYPWEGEPQDAAGAILEFLLADAAGRVRAAPSARRGRA